MVLAVIRRRGNAYELRFFDGRRLGSPIVQAWGEIRAIVRGVLEHSGIPG